MSQKNINIRLSSNVVQLSPGEGTVLAVTVVNNGRGVERLELSVGNIDPGWLLFDQNELLLYPDAPGNEGTVNLQVSLPPNALPGSYSPTIEIRNAGELQPAATTQLVLVVNQLSMAGPEFQLLQESVQTKHKWARFQLQLGNPLDLPQTLKLYGRPNLPSTRLRIIPPVVEVPARGQAISVIEVEPAKRNRIRPGKRYDFFVGAENASGQANGYMVQTASLPLLARILASPFLLIISILLPLLIVAGVIAFILWPRTSTAPTAAQQVARCVTTNTVQTATLRMGEVNTDIYVNDADTGTTRKVQQEPVERLPGIYSTLLSVSPDGKQLAYVTAGDEALNDSVLWVVNLNSSAKQRVAGVPAGFWPTHPIWSQDGTQLGYVVRNGSQLDFYTVNLSDKKTTTIPITQMSPDQFYGDPGVAGPLCFSTDNTRVVLSAAGSSTQLEVSLTDKTAKTVNKPLPAAAGQDKSFAANPANLTEPPLAPLPDSACAVKTFSQNDPLWRDLQMKGRTDNQNDTIGASGCALTSAAMMLNYYKVNTDPNELNACMGSDSNPINWNLPAAQCSDGVVAGAQRDYFSWDGLNDSLNQGQPAVVGLLGGQTGTHFVVVLGGYDSIASTYRVNDPWDGTNNKSLAYYISRGYQLQWLVSFKGANPPTCKPRVAAISDSNPNFVLKQSSPEDGHAYNQPVGIAFTGGTEKTVATLNQFTVSSSSAATTTTATATTTAPSEQTGNQPGQNGTSEVVTNGEQVTGEGAYQLVINSPGDNAVNQRLTTNFVIDQTPPTLTRIPVGAFESNLSATGAQIAHGNVTLQLKATDNLSGIATIEYTVNGGAPQPYTNDVNPKPKVFTDAGEYDVLYRATDGAGNVSAQQEWKFQIVLTNADIGPNSATTVAATTAPVVTTPPADTNAGGGGAAAGSGGGSDAAAGGGGAAGATTPAATTPAVTTPAGPPPILVAAPNQLAFDATMDSTIVPINLNNSGASAVNFTVQPPAGAAANYLKFTSLTGTVPAGGALPFQVQLASLNYSGQPVQGAFNVVYNGNTLQIPFTVAPQPTPTVAFTAPAAGPITGTVAVKMTVTTTGAGKANHINLSAKYLDKIGGTQEERALAGQATASNGWAYNWDVSGLPPQDGIELYARLCWSADDSNCFKIDPGLTGLSIPKPTAAITLDPNNPSLSGIVTLNAAVGGGPLDHITYSYTFKQNNADTGPITITTKANAANQYKVTWDTSSIPPQPTGSPVKLNALVCWTGDDNPATCTAPTSITPATLTVDPPIIVANALSDADAKSLPLTLALGGTVSKLNNPGATVWVEYTITQTVTPLKIVKVVAPATLAAPNNGTAIWSASIDTSNLPPQTINFTPKVCWDGNKDGNYCYQVAVPLVGIIPPLVPAFVEPKPTDFTKPVNLALTATPAGRASSIKVYMSYTRFNGQVQDYVQLTPEATAANNYVVPFDSVALGLAPNQTINFKLVPCYTSSYCTALTDVTTIYPFQIPASTLALTPTQDQLVANPLPSTVPLSGVVTGRNVGDLQLIAAYSDSRFAASGTYSKTLSVGAVQSGQSATTPPFPYSWDTSDIPPQTGVSLSYKLCWNGTLDSGCTTPTVAYTGLTKPAPAIASVSINNGLSYNPAGDKILPIPYSVPFTSTVVNFDLTAVVTDTKISSIKWQLQGISGQGNAAYTKDLANTSVANGKALSTISLNLSELITQTNPSVGGNGAVIPDFNLVGMPVWQGVYTITDTNKIKVEPIKFITFNVNMRGSNQVIVAAPTTSQLATQDAYKTGTTMISTTTGISMTGFSTDGLVKRTYYNVTYNLGSGAPPNTSPQINVPIATAGTPSTPKVGLAANNFQLNWNHTTDLPKILPQTGISLYWQLCNTDADDSGCLPLKMTGSFNHVDNLTLAGVRYDPDPLSNASNVNQGILNFTSKYFNSTFDAYAKVIGGTAIKSVRYIAYPTGASPSITMAVVLNTRENTTTTNADGSWKSSIYWPTPDTATQQNQQAARLLNGLATNHLNMTLAVQMCSTTTPDITNVADTSCSDWTGNAENSLDAASKARVDGKLAIVVVWDAMWPCEDATHNTSTDLFCNQPTSPKDPYSQAIQDGPNANVESRTLTLNVYKVPNAVNSTDYTTNGSVSISTYYITSTNTTNPISGTTSVQQSTASGTIPVYSLQRSWFVRDLVLPTDPDFDPSQPKTQATQRSVKLQAEVNFVIDSSADTSITPGSFIAYATVPTKGRVEPYNPPPVIGISPEPTTVPSTTEPPTTAAPTTTAPTAAPTTTAPTTAANSPNSVPTTAAATTEPPTTVPVSTTDPTTTAPQTTSPSGSGSVPNPA